MWTDDIKLALINLNGIGRNQEIYDEIQKIRPNVSGDWQAVIRRTIQQNSSDTQSWSGNNDLFYSVNGIGQGIWGLREFYPPNNLLDEDLVNNDETTKRRESKIQRIVRDTYIISQLKIFHKGVCQICGGTIQVSSEKFYSEGHHIKPLGKPHNGPDKAENIIIVCPTCHVKCDYHLVKLDKKYLEKSGRVINADFINYHNNLISS